MPVRTSSGRLAATALAAALLGAGVLAGLLALLGAFDDAPPPAASATLTPAQVAQRYDARIAAVARRGLASTAGIETARSDGTTGVGSGVVVGRSGLILTNAHVVDDAEEIRVTVGVPSGAVPDGAEVVARPPAGEPDAATIVRVPGTVVATRSSRDLAVVRASVSGTTPLTLTGARDVELGQSVIAIGYALALTGGPSVTTGVVSGTRRNVAARSGISYRDLIQTDAAINRGNSGGPLLDVRGRVIAINSLAATASTAEDVGFAIDAAEARALVAAARARLGSGAVTPTSGG